MLCFHEKTYPLRQLEGCLLSKMQCEVSAQTSHQVGGALTCSRKCTGPGTIGALAAALAQSLLQLSKPLHTRMKALDLVSLTLAPNSHIILYIYIYHGSTPYQFTKTMPIIFYNCIVPTLWICIMFLQLACSWICKYFHMVVDVSSGLISENSNYWLKCESIFSFLIISSCVQALILFLTCCYQRMRLVYSLTLYTKIN